MPNYWNGRSQVRSALHSSTTGGAKESTLGSYGNILLVGLCASPSAVCLDFFFLHYLCWQWTLTNKVYNLTWKPVLDTTTYLHIAYRRRTMDDSTKRLLQRLVRRIPAQTLPSTLEKWGRLTATQRESIDFTQPKWTLAERLLDICEVCCLFVCVSEHKYASNYLTSYTFLCVSSPFNLTHFRYRKTAGQSSISQSSRWHVRLILLF